MHRTEGPDFVLVGGKRRFKESAPATVVDKDIMNACQEELCLAIENAGLTLRTTGALDESGGWGQLYQAVQRVAFANVLAFGADPTGVADCKTDINDAFAYSKIVYFPAGTYRYTGTLTIPDGATFIGGGINTVLKPDGALQKFPEDINVNLFNLKILGTSTDVAIIASNFTSHKTVVIRDVWIDDGKIIIYARGNGGSFGKVVLDNVKITGTRASGLVLTMGLAGDANSPRLLASKLDITGTDATAKVLSIGGTASDAKRIISDSRITGGIIELVTANNFEINSTQLDVVTYNFNGCNNPVFRNNVIPDTLANTINNNVTNPSRVFWTNNRLLTGAKYPDTITYDGVATKRERTGSQSIGVGTDKVDFDSEEFRAMTNNESYTKTQPWDATNKRFFTPTYGDRLIKVNCQLVIGSAQTDDLAEIAKLYAYIDVVSGDGESVQLMLGKVRIDALPSTGHFVFNYNGTIHIDSQGANHYIEVKVVNSQTQGAVSVLTNFADFKTFIEVEGF